MTGASLVRDSGATSCAQMCVLLVQKDMTYPDPPSPPNQLRCKRLSAGRFANPTSCHREPRLVITALTRSAVVVIRPATQVTRER